MQRAFYPEPTRECENYQVQKTTDHSSRLTSSFSRLAPKAEYGRCGTRHRTAQADPDGKNEWHLDAENRQDCPECEWQDRSSKSRECTSLRKRVGCPTSRGELTAQSVANRGQGTYDYRCPRSEPEPDLGTNFASSGCTFRVDLGGLPTRVGIEETQSRGQRLATHAKSSACAK